MNTTTTLESAILSLFEKTEQINLSYIAAALGLDATLPNNQRTIQRALKKLILTGKVSAIGAARSRAYTLNKNDQPKLISNNTTTFANIPLSVESQNLLHYLSQPTKDRNTVGYQPDFLRSYIPNQSRYLDHDLQTELFSIGNAEPIIQPAGSYARKLFNTLLIDISWNSSRLEGNTYSLLETQRLLELGETATEKNSMETQMILNHKDAIEYIMASVEEPSISAHEIYSLHALLSNGLLGNPRASGNIRSIAVGVSGTTYQPLNNPHLLQEYFTLIIEKLNLINDPFEQSFFALIHISYLQAFEDVNKRTGRLTANIPFIKKNLRPLAFFDVEQKDYATALLGVYEKNDISLIRDLYVWAYKQSAKHYTGVLQSTLDDEMLFRIKHRAITQNIIRQLVLEKIPGNQLVNKIKQSIKTLNFSEQEATKLRQIIESEIISLHDGNIARFKIRPSEFDEWKKVRLL